MNKDIVLLELFSGIGGFSRGLSEAGFNITKCYFSEIDKHAIANYKYNFPEAEHLGSVTDVLDWDIERPNIITFGSPCQDLSLAGKRAGLKGVRSSLIEYAFTCIERFRPDVFIWENVKGAYSSNAGADYWAIQKAFADLDGYRHEEQLLDSIWFVPQHRERIYHIGHLGEWRGCQVFPFGEELAGANEGTIETTSVRTLTAGGHSGGMHSSMTLLATNLQGNVFSNTLRGGGRGSLTEKHNWDYIKVATNTKQGYDIAEPGDTVNLTNPSSAGLRGRIGKGCAQTLDTACNQAVVTDFLSQPLHVHGEERVYKDAAPTVQSRYGTGGDNIPYVNNIRRLTEVECERLQAYPDQWTQFGIYEKQVWTNKKLKTFEIIQYKHPIPMTQRYKLIGNAVTVAVVKEIGKRLLK